MTAKKWMNKAFRPENRGKFTAKAKAHGEGVQQYAKEVTAEGSKASTKTKRQANLAKTAKAIARKKK